MRHPSFSIIVVLVAICAPALATAQTRISTDAARSVDALRTTSSPGLDLLVSEGRVTFVRGLREPTSAATPVEAALEFLGRYGALARVDDPRAQLSLRSAVDVGRTTYLRFDVEHQGLRVIGSQVTVSVRDGEIRHLGSGIRRWTEATEGPAVPPAEAVRAVEAWSGRRAGSPTEQAWLQLGDRLVLVWIVPQREAAPLRDWRYIVEATTGTVLWRYDQLLRAEGLIYDPNPEAAGGETTRVELPRLESAEVLEGTRAAAYQCVGESDECDGWGSECACSLREHYALADADGNFLYEPSEPDLDDPFAEVQAYYHTDLVNQWFEDHLGYSRRCGGSRVIDVHVNYYVLGDPYTSANAFYGDSSGDGCGDITLGEGLGVDFGYDGDVIYHEFTHSIVEALGGLGCPPFGICHDELGLDWTALGLNEGYADYYSVTITDDPALGEHAGLVMTTGEGVIRHAENDHLCPFDLVGESHYDGQIWLGAAWEVRELLGAEVADRLMFRVLNSLFQDADYAEAGIAMMEAAQTELDDGEIDEEQLAGVEAILGPEGRRITGCRRIIPLDAVPEGHAEEHMVLQSWRAGMTFPTGIQWSLDAPRRAERLAYIVEDELSSSEQLTVHVRRGEPVGVEMDITPGVGLTVTWTEDYAVTLDDDTLEITPESDPPLEPETTYYFALEYSCSRGCYLRARGEVEAAPNQAPVAEAGEEQEVEVGATVELDGSASYDPEGDDLLYSWAQVSGPDVTLEGATAARASFAAAEAGEHTFQLAVEDTEGGTGTDTVLIRVVDPSGDGGPDGGDDDDDGGGCGCRAADASASPAAPALLRALLP